VIGSTGAGGQPFTGCTIRGTDSVLTSANGTGSADKANFAEALVATHQTRNMGQSPT